MAADADALPELPADLCAAMIARGCARIQARGSGRPLWVGPVAGAPSTTSCYVVAWAPATGWCAWWRSSGSRAPGYALGLPDEEAACRRYLQGDGADVPAPVRSVSAIWRHRWAITLLDAGPATLTCSQSVGARDDVHDCGKPAVSICVNRYGKRRPFCQTCMEGYLWSPFVNVEWAELPRVWHVVAAAAQTSWSAPTPEDLVATLAMHGCIRDIAEALWLGGEIERVWAARPT